MGKTGSSLRGATRPLLLCVCLSVGRSCTIADTLAYAATRALGSRLTILLLVAAVLSGGAATLAAAEPVTYGFTGTAISTYGTFAGQGTAVTGFYTLDPDNLVVDRFPDSAEIDWWQSYHNRSAVWEISVTVGTFTLTSVNNAPTTSRYLYTSDRDSGDEWILEASVDLDGDNYFHLEARDFTPVPPDGIADGSNNLNGVPILTPGDLSAYSATPRGEVIDFDQILWDEWGDPNTLGHLVFTLDSVIPVPEPSTGLLVVAGLLGLARWRRARA
jgi:hypothetical protein